MKKTIYFDLETTSLSPIGQIVNYCFVVVDRGEIIESLEGDIRLHPSQLPEPGATVVTGIDYLEHQSNPNSISEIEAMLKISDLLKRHTPLYTQRTESETYLVGHNSLSFDLPFLRTCMIRNGINPYHGNKLVNSDFMEYARTLYLMGDKHNITKHEKPVRFRLSDLFTNDRWQERLSKKAKALDVENKLGLAHHSIADTYRLMLCAECLADVGETHISDFPLYAPMFPGDVHETKTLVEKIEVVMPQHQKQPIGVIESKAIPLMFLLSRKNYQLWYNLKEYSPKKKIDIKQFKWFNRNSTSFYGKELGVENQSKVDEIHDRVMEFWGELPGETVEEKLYGSVNENDEIDIEANIYKMPLQLIDRLTEVRECLLREQPLDIRIENKEFGTLVERQKMRLNENIDDLKTDTTFRNYIINRYGGKLRTDKGFGKAQYHPTLFAMIEDAEKMRTSENDKIVDSLVSFYKGSLVYEILREEGITGS